LSLKIKVNDLSVVWHQNHWDSFLRFGLKTGADGFLWVGIKTGGDSFLVEPQNQGGGGFPGLGLKIDTYGLVIWGSKSPRRFLDLCLKTMQVSVCQLRHKTDGRIRQRETRVEIYRLASRGSKSE
jgi:hypothetical protein